ncbi:sugar ABC transporter substrate-binding protein [Consotaella sp. CSK11QG-6]
MAGLGAGPAAAQDAPVTIHWALWDWDATAYYQPLIEAYEAEHPNVTVDHVDLGSTDYNMMLSTQLTGGASDLDVITVKDTPGYATLVNAGQLLDLSSFIQGQNIDTAQYSGIVEQLQIDGKPYALPFRSDFWIVYYNKDLFDNAGVDYPTNDMTFDQFADLARKLTTGFGPNKIYGTLFHIWRSPVQLYGILDGQHTMVDGDYGFLKPWYEKILALQEEGVVPSYAQLKTSSTHYSAPFYNSTVAMLPMGSWFIGTQIAKVKSGESKATNWGIVKYPHPEGIPAGTTLATLATLGVNAASQHQEAALDFLKFVTGPEGAKVIAQTGTLPAIRDEAVLDTITSLDGFPQDKNSREALQTEQTYLEMPIHPKSADIEVVLNRAHDSIMTDNETVDEGIEEMNKGVAEILSR